MKQLSLLFEGEVVSLEYAAGLSLLGLLVGKIVPLLKALVSLLSEAIWQLKDARFPHLYHEVLFYLQLFYRLFGFCFL